MARIVLLHITTIILTETEYAFIYNKEEKWALEK
jgi:hypothetical protein